MGVIIINDRPGWSREITEFEDGSRYICDSTIRDGNYEYHEYNISADNCRHSHIHGIYDDDNDDFRCGGHEEDTRPWRD